MGQDEYGRLETTSAAANRNGAVFGVNGGGFFYAGQHDIYLPVGNTVINGQLLGNFVPARDDVFFLFRAL
ncbi:MAG: hypothetical protein C4554_02655 [Dethiobacter sp.]|nr:MAG: hypothetical protein C4554_02655 [Dethiobacter sp.]